MSNTAITRFTVTPETAHAGEVQTFRLQVAFGPGVPNTPFELVFDFPATLGTSRPTLLHQEAEGYVCAFCDNPAVTWRMRLWNMERQQFLADGNITFQQGKATRTVAVELEGVTSGDVFTLTWGDTGNGYGVGTRMPTVVPRNGHQATIDVRYFATPGAGFPDLGRSFLGYERPTPLEELSAAINLRPRAAQRVRVVRSTNRALVLPLDGFDNLGEADPRDVADCPPGGRRNDGGALEYADPDVAIGRGPLPLSTAPGMRDVVDGYHLYWGDVHTHSSVSNDCIEREKLEMTPADLMLYGRDRAGLDFCAVTDHHQPWDQERNHVGRAGWDAIRAAAERFDDPGRFLAFAGFEFRDRRGDTVVLPKWFADYDEIDRAEFGDIRRIWDAWHGRDYLTIPHFHNAGRLDDGEWWPCPDPRVEPVVEMFSCHGSFEPDAMEQRAPMIKARRPDRNMAWLLQQGHRYGLCANSDGHKGHIGSNGLTAVFAKELTKDALFEAYRSRRVYATTNARIRLVVTGNGELMGADLGALGDLQLGIRVRGEAPLKKVWVYHNGNVVQRYAPEGLTFEQNLTMKEPQPGAWYVKVVQIDNHAAWSSPIFVGAAG